jgi:hypothetical protein
MLAAIGEAKAQAAAASEVKLSLDAAGEGISIEVGSGEGAGRLWLFGFDPGHTTRVAGGETLIEVNVVRSIASPGTWSGATTKLQLARPPGSQFAVLLQKDTAPSSARRRRSGRSNEPPCVLAHSASSESERTARRAVVLLSKATEFCGVLRVGCTELRRGGERPARMLDRHPGCRGHAGSDRAPARN